MNYDWQEVYVDYINESYEAFLETFLTIYDRRWSLKEYRQNSKKEEETVVNKAIIEIQKRVIRIIHKASYRETTNPLFITSGILKCLDIVHVKTLEILFRVRNKSLPVSIQKHLN